MRIATLQFAPKIGCVEENIARADSLLASSTTPLDNLDLLVLPELAFTASHILSSNTTLLVLSTAWLTNLPSSVLRSDPQEPDWDTVRFWLERLSPLLEPQKEVSGEMADGIGTGAEKKTGNCGSTSLANGQRGKG
ncbi:MAG: hypothetical protein LQ350_001203 [Teloschistes chrysophthalmus]|nr:MAG: hypothetical protein LQ350_001203 [Niorma chrysophthalma]